MGIAVAIAVGIGSTIATAVAASYAGMQADLSRQALSSNERNKAFEGLVGAMSAYCEALDFSKGRSELTWSVDRGTEKYRVVASYRDIGTQFQQPSALGTVHEQLHKLEASAVPLGIWFDSDSVSFVERTVFSLKREFVGAFGPRARLPAAARTYVSLAAKCIGVREVLMAWYQHPSSWPISSASERVEVGLTARQMY